MSDTAPRTPTGMSRMMADALLRSVGGASAHLRVTGANASTSQSEVGIVATTFAEVVLSPVIMRRLRPSWKVGEQPQWELLVSATSIAAQVSALDLASSQALFDLTLAVVIEGQDFLIESIASNEAFGQTYLYRLTLRAGRPQAL